jgi:hypothetical protein
MCEIRKMRRLKQDILFLSYLHTLRTKHHMRVCYTSISLFQYRSPNEQGINIGTNMDPNLISTGFKKGTLGQMLLSLW